MGKLTMSMAIFNSCVCLPEGKIRDQLLMMFFSIVLAVATGEKPTMHVDRFPFVCLLLKSTSQRTDMIPSGNLT